MAIIFRCAAPAKARIECDSTNMLSAMHPAGKNINRHRRSHLQQALEANIQKRLAQSAYQWIVILVKLTNKKEKQPYKSKWQSA